MDSRQRSRYACDACKRRKVKCNGLPKCNQCTHLNLDCHYSKTTPSSRSRKSIVRGTVINAYRESTSDQRPRLLDRSPLRPALPIERQVVPTDLPQYSATFFSGLLQDYATFVLPTLPIITEIEFASAIAEIEEIQASCALVHVLGAMTFNMTCPGPGREEINGKHVMTLCKQALYLRGPLMPDHQVTVRSITIPLFAATCLSANDCYSDMAFHYLREAITGVHILRVDSASRTALLSPSDRAQRQRLYWVLFIHERLLSINYYKRPTLSGLPELLQPDPTVPEGIINGFNHLIRLFQIIDDTFMTNWLDKHSPTLSRAWIEKKQSQLGGGPNDNWEDELKHLTQMQQIDLIVTRDWLRTLVWQMALSRFLLTMNECPDRQFMEILFPARISRRLRMALTDMPRLAVEVHGTGILLKVFDITSRLADLLEHVLQVKICDDQDVADQLDDFSFLFGFLDGMSKVPHIEKTVLKTRYETIRGLCAPKPGRELKTLHSLALPGRPTEDLTAGSRLRTGWVTPVKVSDNFTSQATRSCYRA